MGRMWEYHYRINALGYRGNLIPIQEHYEKKNIVILGDSYSFGTGVDEGEQYAAIMARNLESYAVVNLGVGGWGLTQQIRRYYDLGRKYRPSVVIIQFCSNDPDDNLKLMVTVIENGKFAFKNIVHEKNVFGISLSGSIIQKSQVYNILRFRLYELISAFKKKHHCQHKDLPAVTLSARSSPSSTGQAVPEAERFYVELFRKFTHELRRDGVAVIVIAVNGQLDGFPYIKKEIDKLNDRKVIEYLEVAEWFNINDKRYWSPEGHVWGSLAHRIIGEKLAEYIRKRFR